jgi:hypothetical protein
MISRELTKDDVRTLSFVGYEWATAGPLRFDHTVKFLLDKRLLLQTQPEKVDSHLNSLIHLSHFSDMEKTILFGLLPA